MFVTKKIIEYFTATIIAEMKDKREPYLIINPYRRGITLKKSVMNQLRGNNIYESITKR